MGIVKELFYSMSKKIFLKQEDGNYYFEILSNNGDESYTFTSDKFELNEISEIAKSLQNFVDKIEMPF